MRNDTGSTAFARRVAEASRRLSPVERTVADFFAANREEVLVSAARRIAERVGASDATVVRTAKALGYSGLAALRRELADELRADLSPAARIARTLDEAGSDPAAVLRLSLEENQASLTRLRQEMAPETFDAAIRTLAKARRVAVFGIGPSSALAGYLAMQLGRFGKDAIALTNTGLLFADDLHRLRKGDALVIMAFTRVYAEVTALAERARELDLRTILITDSLTDLLGDHDGLVFLVARGRAGMFSMHTPTLALLEAFLLGVAAKQEGAVVSELVALNRLRSSLSGKGMSLPAAFPLGKRRAPGPTKNRRRRS